MLLPGEGSLKPRNTALDILESTGPFFLTRIYDSYYRKSEATLLSADKLYPLTIEDLQSSLGRDLNTLFESKFKNAFAIHLFKGTWWNELFY